MGWMQNQSNKDFGEKLRQVFSTVLPEQIIPSIEGLQLLLAYYQCAMMEIETKFKVLGREFAIWNDRNPINSIQCRTKSALGIHEKLAKKGIEPSIESRITLSYIRYIRNIVVLIKRIVWN